jgi:hypothetical protein
MAKGLELAIFLLLDATGMGKKDIYLSGSHQINEIFNVIRLADLRSKHSLHE